MEHNLQLPNPEPENKHSSFDIVGLFRGLGKVMSEVGIAGFLVIAFILYVFFCTSQVYKDRITDKWILFEGDDNYPFTFIVLMLILLLFVQQLHYKRVIKLKDQRIAEIADGKSSRYAQQLKQQLSTSIKNKKR